MAGGHGAAPAAASSGGSHNKGKGGVLRWLFITMVSVALLFVALVVFSNEKSPTSQPAGRPQAAGQQEAATSAKTYTAPPCSSGKWVEVSGTGGRGTDGPRNDPRLNAQYLSTSNTWKPLPGDGGYVDGYALRYCSRNDSPVEIRVVHDIRR